MRPIRVSEHPKKNPFAGSFADSAARSAVAPTYTHTHTHSQSAVRSVNGTREISSSALTKCRVIRPTGETGGRLEAAARIIHQQAKGRHASHSLWMVAASLEADKAQGLESGKKKGSSRTSGTLPGAVASKHRRMAPLLCLDALLAVWAAVVAQGGPPGPLSTLLSPAARPSPFLSLSLVHHRHSLVPSLSLSFPEQLDSCGTAFLLVSLTLARLCSLSQLFAWSIVFISFFESLGPILTSLAEHTNHPLYSSLFGCSSSSEKSHIPRKKHTTSLSKWLPSSSRP